MAVGRFQESRSRHRKASPAPQGRTGTVRHADLEAEPLHRRHCRAEDVGNPRLGMSELYDYMPVYGLDAAGMLACAEVAFGELLLSAGRA